MTKVCGTISGGRGKSGWCAVHGIVTIRVISLLFFGSLNWREEKGKSIFLLRFLFEGRVFYKYSLTCCSLFFFREKVASEMKERIYYNFILLFVSI